MLHLKSGLIALLLLFSVTAGAVEQWIVDPHSILSSNTVGRLNNLLSETAQGRGVCIRLFLTNDIPEESFDNQYREIIENWEKGYNLSKQKCGYIVINAATKEAKLALHFLSIPSEALREGLHNLAFFGMGPLLEEDDVEGAIFQGVIGLSNILVELSQTSSSSWYKKLLDAYDSFFIFRSLISIVFYGLIGLSIIFYLYTPSKVTN